MILPSKHLHKKKKALLQLMGKDEAVLTKALRGYLNEDPYDWMTLECLGRRSLGLGEMEEAASLFWRAIRAAPNEMAAYVGLVNVLGRADDADLCTALVQLAYRRGLHDPTQRKTLEAVLTKVGEPIPGPDDSYRGGLQSPAAALTRRHSRQQRNEPARVTKLLATLRAIHEILDPEIGRLDQASVDCLLANPEESAPLLEAVIREWAGGRLTENGAWSAELSFALLGEIGDAAALPELLGFAELNKPEVINGIAYACCRILEKNPSIEGQLPPSLTHGGSLRLRAFLEYRGSRDGQTIQVTREMERKVSRPGRNDPCWCGSGKKYKKCHLDADNARGGGSADPSDAGRLTALLLKFVKQSLTDAEMAKAMKVFFGDERENTVKDMQSAFFDWILYDYVPEKFGRPVVEEFLEREGRYLPERDRALAVQWTRSRYSIYEVVRVEKGIGVEVMDLLRGEAAFVHSVGAFQDLRPSERLLTRLRGEGSTMVFSAIGGLIAESVHEPFLEWVKQDRAATGLEWNEYLRANSHRLSMKYQRFMKESMDSLRVGPTDTAGMVFSTRRYTVLDREKLLAALEAASEVSEIVKETKFEIMDQQTKRVLGVLLLKDDQILLECTNRPRLEIAQAFVERVGGSFVEIGAAEFRKLDAILGGGS